jgi:hypothetical protein
MNRLTNMEPLRVQDAQQVMLQAVPNILAVQGTSYYF